MSLKTACTGLLLSLVFVLHQTAAGAADWSRFRGPNGTGVSPDEKSTPVQWSESENLKWKTKLPGPGSSSPIVVGDRVFVTCWSGYGTDRGNPGDQNNLRRHLVCIDRQTGKTLWDKSVEPVLPEDRYGGMFAEHGYASHTPISDGQHVYVFFGKTGVLAFDLEGNQLWQTNVGKQSDRRGWGTAASPVLYKNLVIVTASAESEALVALDKQTGKEVWRQEAGGFSGTWGTPVLVQVDADRTDLVLAVPFEIWGFDPETGKLRWYCEGVDSDSMCSSVVEHEGIIYAVEGRSGSSIAVRAGGTDDVSKTHVVWSGRDRGRISTPVYHDGRLYFINGGVANCIDAKTGARVYQARIERLAGQAAGAAQGGRGGFGGRGGGPGGQDYSSPVIADGKLYYVMASGDMIVAKLGTTYEQLAANRFRSDNSGYSATPAISDGELFIRSNSYLYCVSETE
jgi:hypothetical protein